nr:MAG TPA: repressor protein CI [Caudoviricetes sp.]
MERKERFKEAFEYLKSRGSVHTQRDIALKMDSSEGNISKVFKGDERFLTNRFLRRFNEAYGNIFNIEWLIDGVGEMLVVNNGSIGNLVIGDGNTNTNQGGGGGGNTTNNRNTTTTTTNNYSGCGCGGVDTENTLITSSMYQALFDELSAQRKVTEKAQAQIDTLLDIIRGISDK